MPAESARRPRPTITIAPTIAPSTAGHRDGAGIHVLAIRTSTATPSTTIGTTAVKT